MKHKIFMNYLQLLKAVTGFMQIGNPAGRGPSLMEEPPDAYFLKTLPGIPDYISLWKFNNTLCSGLYGGAVIDEKNLVYSRFLNFPWGKELHPVLSYPFLGSKTAHIDKGIFVLSVSAKGNYYHWIADLLPRLLFIQKCNLPDFEERMVILHSVQRPYENESLQLMGIGQDKVLRLRKFEIIGVKDLIMADYLLSRDGKPFPFWKRQLLNEFKEKVLGPVRKGRRKIYLLRGKQKTRRLIGEEKLTETLSSMGFEIVDPQKMTLKEQMETLSGAEVVVALHGAALANIVFCSEGTLVLELRSSHKPPEYYSEIAKTFCLRFESISLPPLQLSEAGNLANEQDLIFTNESLNLLLSELNAVIPARFSPF